MTEKWRTLLLFAVIAIGTFCAIYGYALMSRPIKLPTFEEINRELAVVPTATVNAFMEEQKKGKGGLEYWDYNYYREEYGSVADFLDEPKPPTFLAVRSWEIVDVSIAAATVRIESSNLLGQPVSVLWKFWLCRDGTRIWEIEEAQKP